MKRQGRVFMWLDNASDIDILFYEPYARIIADIAKNEQYNPLTVGVFGLWGAGKSTLLKLIGEKLKSQDGIICVTINAWMFESYDDAKTAIMEALLQELKEEVPVEETKKKLGKLIKRVDWFKLGTKAISTLAPVVASVATGNPLPMLLNVTGSAEEIGNTVKNAANSIQSLKDEYWKEEDVSNDESTINNIRKFREEFSDALKSDDIKNVVVMIDDLDRCRPERIIEILEVIKLFLSVDRTTFIIAADENVIKYSIREKYPPMNGFDVELDKEYIEKIIQLPIYIPELSAKDIQNYLLLLVTQSYLEQESFKHLIDKIFEEKRTISGDVITLEEINKLIDELGLNWQDGGKTAFKETAKIIDEIREIVASTLKGNPRQAKRFLNTFITKRQLAKIYYGDEIDISILAKLLVLQKLDNDLFIQLNEWNKEFDTENKEFKEIRTKVKEGKVDAQNPWNTAQIKKWLECKPVELEKYRLEKYFYLTRENLKRSSIDESGFSKNTKEILERIGRAKSGQMVAIIKDMKKLSAEEIADTFKVVASKIEKGEMKFFVVRDLFLNFDALLFLCAALSVAGILGENVPVYIPENGFIGLNIPLTGGRKGTCSTRTTHPHFLRQFNDILETVGIKNSITNFFAYNTKREIVGQVKDTDAFKSCYADTISCSHPCLARYNKKGSKEYPVNCGYCYPCLIRKSSLLDIDEIKKYSYQGEAYDFLIEYEESEKSADLRAVLGSIYRCKYSSDKELKRYIRCVGELTEEEVEKFLSLYKKSIEDLVQLFSADQRMKEYLGL